MPVLYVFGRGSLDVDDLASALLSGPLSVVPPGAASAGDGESPSSPLAPKVGAGPGVSGNPPVLLLYDVTYAHAIPALLERLSGVAREGKRLVVGFPTPEAYSPLGAGSATASQGGGCGCGATSTPTVTSASSQEPKQEQQLLASGGAEAARTCCRGSSKPGAQGTGGGGCSEDGKARCGGGDTSGQTPKTSQEETETAGGGADGEKVSCAAAPAGCSRNRTEQEQASTTTAAVARGSSSPPTPEGEGAQQQQPPSEKRRVRIGGLGVELESEEELQRHVLVFVGGEGRQLSNVLMRCAGCVDRVRYDPALPPGQRVVGDTRKGNKDLMRRYIHTCVGAGWIWLRRSHFFCLFCTGWCFGLCANESPR